MKARVQRLRAQIAADQRAIAHQLAELAALDPASLPVSKGARAMTAVALHALYSAVEMVFERAARTLEGEPPTGPDWHQNLLEEMALELDDVRPAVISATTRSSLRALLGFRHFFRHAYAVELDASKLAPLREAALKVGPVLAVELRRFDDFLRRLADRAAP